MDARTVAQHAGVPLGTLNVWVQRGQLPYLQPGIRGRRRDINYKSAIKIAVFAQIMKFGISSYDAVKIIEKIGSQIFKAHYVLVDQPHAHAIHDDGELHHHSASYLIINLKVLNNALRD